MAKFIIEHDRPNCISCGVCAVVHPKNWEMDDDGDGKSKVKDVHIGDEEDFKGNKEAAVSCPVNVIHIIDTTNNEKII